MKRKLQRNQSVRSKKREYRIIDFLGDGGQGEVYLAQSGGRECAIKIYKQKVHPAFRANLSSNIEKGSPASTFLWPRAIIEGDDYFGYAMDLRPKKFVSFVSYLNGKSRFRNQETMLRWCIELCESFKKLHSKGYSYQDLNDGSFFLDPDTGELLICDNDNVAANKTSFGVLGKMRYMAPEVARGDIDPLTKARQMPDTHSDRFSLAVILFMTLCYGHPYDGKRWENYEIGDGNAFYDMYVNNPVFVYHKTDKSNRPHVDDHKLVIALWDILPIYIKEAFHRAFVDGLSDRENGRLTESEWIRLLSRYRDELTTCSQNESHQYSYGVFDRKMRTECPFCGAMEVLPPFQLCIGKQSLLLAAGKHLFQHHVDEDYLERNQEIGEVIRSKKDPKRIGIRLTNGEIVLVKDAQGNKSAVAEGGVIPLEKGTKIKFKKNRIGEIK
ncbi:MAG: hypothetical protein IJV87_04270 [Clostridia bacterium]|nr:hypothetical protein [Clostridia bacterium]